LAERLPSAEAIITKMGAVVTQYKYDGLRAILDAETLAYNATSEEFLPFQETTRRRRKHGIEAMAEQLPLKAFVFDILYKDRVSLLDAPLAQRLRILEETMYPADDTLMLTMSHA